MVLILNNNTESPIPVTDFEYNYLVNEFHAKNFSLDIWSSDLISYIISLKEVPITSVLLKNDDGEVLALYSNLNVVIINVNDSFNYDSTHNIIHSKNIDLG